MQCKGFRVQATASGDVNRAKWVGMCPSVNCKLIIKKKKEENEIRKKMALTTITF